MKKQKEMRKTLILTPRSHHHSPRLNTTLYQLTQFIKKQYPTKIPIDFVTSISKTFAKSNPTTKQSKIIKHLVQPSGMINTAKFVDYLTSQNQYEKGKMTDQNVKNIYQSSCNSEGKMSVQCLIKMGEECGFVMDQKTASAIVKKYGKRKDFMTVEDCQKVIKRKQANTEKSQQPSRSRKH